MADPVDYFMQGVGLGQRSRSMAIQQTNLAERATQTNRELDIRERQADANLSRLNLLNKQMDYDITRQKDDDNEKTVQLDLLKQYTTDLTEAANGLDFGKSLPMPPSGLHGVYHEQAIKTHSAYLKSRQEDRNYKRYVSSIEDENDLVDNWGLPFDYRTAEPEAQKSMWATAQENRAFSKATDIARSMGVDIYEVRAMGIEIPLNPYTGKLEENVFKTLIQKMSPQILQSKTTYPSGQESETFTTKEAQAQKEAVRNASEAIAHGRRMQSEIRRRSNELKDLGFSEADVQAKLITEFPPDGEVFNDEGEVTERLWIGDINEDESTGEQFIYRGGNPSSKSSWVRRP